MVRFVFFIKPFLSGLKKSIVYYICKLKLYYTITIDSMHIHLHIKCQVHIHNEYVYMYCILLFTYTYGSCKCICTVFFIFKFFIYSASLLLVFFNIYFLYHRLFLKTLSQYGVKLQPIKYLSKLMLYLNLK